MGKKANDRVLRATAQKQAVHLFGCTVCEIMILLPPTETKVRCPNCKILIDLFVPYKGIAIHGDVALVLPADQVKFSKHPVTL